MHSIFRNGKLYDSLDPKRHAVIQITRSYARDMMGDTFTVLDENGEVYYQVLVEVKK